jgi:hypothetical protein
VISEAAVWSVFGHQGLTEYHRKRVDATARVPSLRNTGYSGCFHDTTQVLAVVNDTHRDVSHARRTNIDHVVSQVVHTVGGMMIKDASKRPVALTVYEDLARAIEWAAPTEHVAPSSPSDFRNSMHSQLSPSLPSGLGITPSPQSPNGSQRNSLHPTSDGRGTISESANARLSFGVSVTGQEETQRQSLYEVAHNNAHGLRHIPTSGINSPVPGSSAPVGRTALPAASIAEVLHYITRKKAYAGTTLPDEEWFNRLHGRDQVRKHAQVAFSNFADRAPLDLPRR